VRKKFDLPLEGPGSLCYIRFLAPVLPVVLIDIVKMLREPRPGGQGRFYSGVNALFTFRDG